MRAPQNPADLPRRRRVPRGRIGLLVVVALVFVLLTSLRGIAVFYTDYLWFGELNLTSVWRNVLGAKILLAAAFTALFFGLLWLNLVIADRLAPKFRTAGADDEIVQRYRETVGPHAGKIRIGIALLFALMSGTGVSSQWHNWLLFRNGATFGVNDAQFHRDVGFYVFRLPFISFVIDWTFVALVIVAAVTLAAHYLNGGIRVQGPPGGRVTPLVKAHISVLLGAMALVKAVGYYYDRFELNFSTRGAVHGATYTDVKAQLPAINLLIFISLAAAVLFLVNIRRQGWVLPAIAVGLWAFISVVVGAIYPAFIQQFRVNPAENARERPYIERNIKATRLALGLDKVVVKPFDYKENLDAAALAANAPTISNVRLWDPKWIAPTYRKLQEIRGYYRFNDIDIDRYTLDGQITQTLIAARELNQSGLPGASRSWVNRHLQYTHGYGAVLAPANGADREGQPSFIIKDVPPAGSPAITEPRIYYGTNSGGYAIVRTKQAELDFVKPTGGDQTTTYSGTGGVRLNSFFRRVALFLRFSDPNILISSQPTNDSRAIFLRDIGARVRTAAPFLRYDSDPYPVIIKGRILWVQDAYTTTSRYPYSEMVDTDRLPPTSGLRSTFNYVRNSVKVVIDAYHGSMTFYLMDDKDPIAQTYAKVFPTLFTPASAMDDELRRHLRYPEDLFRAQTNMYGRYHILGALEFYNAGDAWNVSQDPGSGPVGAGITPGTTLIGAAAAPQEERMDPTYLLMRLPGEEKLKFVILQPFVPKSERDQQRNLTAFMIAKSDPESYGEMEAYVTPAGRQIDGPALVDARIAADPTISQAISLLNREGSRVILGNVLIVPIEQSLLYVRPLYVTAERNQLPELKKVIVVYARRAAMEDTLQQALAAIFGSAPATLEERTTGEPATPSDESVQQLLERAEQAFNEADAALRRGDLAEYQRKNREGQDHVRAARERAGAPPRQTTTTTAAASA